jgi:hypothetical protein
MLICVCLRILASLRIPRYDLGRQTPHFWGGSVTPTPRSLADTGRGYLGIATTLFPPFPSEGSTSPPNGPAQSQIIHTTFTNWNGEGTSPKSHEWEPPPDFYRNLPSKPSITNSKPPQDGVTRINWKDNLNVSTVPSNSYNLMLKHMVL